MRKLKFLKVTAFALKEEPILTNNSSLTWPTYHYFNKRLSSTNKLSKRDLETTPLSTLKYKLLSPAGRTTINREITNKAWALNPTTRHLQDEDPKAPDQSGICVVINLMTKVIQKVRTLRKNLAQTRDQTRSKIKLSKKMLTNNQMVIELKIDNLHGPALKAASKSGCNI